MSTRDRGAQSFFGGKHAVITGASSGIGEALARELAHRGARVTLVARREERLHTLARELAADGADASVLPWDLSVAEAGLHLGARLLRERPAVDVLVNNAGTSGDVAPFLDKSPDAIRKTFELNLVAPAELMRTLLPEMLRRRGVVVNVSSIMAWAPAPCSSTYTASKRALAALDEVLRGELEGSKVRIISVFPGLIDTAMLRATLEQPNGARLRRLPIKTARDMAHVICEAMVEGREVTVFPSYFQPMRHLMALAEGFVAMASPWLGWHGLKTVPREPQGSCRHVTSVGSGFQIRGHETTFSPRRVWGSRRVLPLTMLAFALVALVPLLAVLTVVQVLASTIAGLLLATGVRVRRDLFQANSRPEEETGASDPSEPDACTGEREVEKVSEAGRPRGRRDQVARTSRSALIKGQKK